MNCQNRVDALPDPMSVKSNDKKENQGKVSSISPYISGEIWEFCFEIIVGTLYNIMTYFSIISDARLHSLAKCFLRSLLVLCNAYHVCF